MLRIAFSPCAGWCVFFSGNRFIPAGKISWEAILHKNGTYGWGRALQANDGFVDPRWVAGEFHADAADKFAYYWTGDRGATRDVDLVAHFRRYDPETDNPVTDDNGAAITNTYLLEGRLREGMAGGTNGERQIDMTLQS